VGGGRGRECTGLCQHFKSSYQVNKRGKMSRSIFERKQDTDKLRQGDSRRDGRFTGQEDRKAMDDEEKEKQHSKARGASRAHAQSPKTATIPSSMAQIKKGEGARRNSRNVLAAPSQGGKKVSRIVRTSHVLSHSSLLLGWRRTGEPLSPG